MKSLHNSFQRIARLSKLADPGSYTQQVALAICIALLTAGEYWLWTTWSRAALAGMAVLGALGMIIVYRFPLVGVLSAVFIVTSNLGILPSGLVTPLLIATLAAIIVRKLMSGDMTWTVTRFTFWGVLFLTWSYVATVWAPSYDHFSWTWAYRCLLIVLVLSETVKTPRQLMLTISSAGIGIVVATVTALQSAMEFFSTGAASELNSPFDVGTTNRYYGDWVDPNYMAAAFVAFVGFGYALARSRVSIGFRLIGVITMLGTLVGVLLSLSRGGIIALSIVVSGIILAERRRLALLVVAVSVTILAALVLPTDVVGRMMTLVSPSVDGSVSQRSMILREGFQLAADSFPFGNGLGNFRTYISDYAYILAYGMLAHNAYLEVMVESGIIGLLLFMLLLPPLFRATHVKKRQCDLAEPAQSFAVTARATLWAIIWTHVVLNTEFYGPIWIVMTLISIIPIVFADREKSVEKVSDPAFS